VQEVHERRGKILWTGRLFLTRRNAPAHAPSFLPFPTFFDFLHTSSHRSALRPPRLDLLASQYTRPPQQQHAHGGTTTTSVSSFVASCASPHLSGPAVTTDYGPGGADGGHASAGGARGRGGAVRGVRAGARGREGQDGGVPPGAPHQRPPRRRRCVPPDGITTKIQPFGSSPLPNWLAHLCLLFGSG
jgi:hypothetical protein